MAEIMAICHLRTSLDLNVCLYLDIGCWCVGIKIGLPLGVGLGHAIGVKIGFFLGFILALVYELEQVYIFI